MDEAPTKIKKEQKHKQSKLDQNKSTWPPSHLLAETPPPPLSGKKNKAAPPKVIRSQYRQPTCL